MNQFCYFHDFSNKCNVRRCIEKHLWSSCSHTPDPSSCYSTKRVTGGNATGSITFILGLRKQIKLHSASTVNRNFILVRSVIPIPTTVIPKCSGTIFVSESQKCTFSFLERKWFYYEDAPQQCQDRWGTFLVYQDYIFHSRSFCHTRNCPVFWSPEILLLSDSPLYSCSKNTFCDIYFFHLFRVWVTELLI